MSAVGRARGGPGSGQACSGGTRKSCTPSLPHPLPTNPHIQPPADTYPNTTAILEQSLAGAVLPDCIWLNAEYTVSAGGAAAAPAPAPVEAPAASGAGARAAGVAAALVAAVAALLA